MVCNVAMVPYPDKQLTALMPMSPAQPAYYVIAVRIVAPMATCSPAPAGMPTSPQAALPFPHQDVSAGGAPRSLVGSAPYVDHGPLLTAGNRGELSSQTLGPLQCARRGPGSAKPRRERRQRVAALQLNLLQQRQQQQARRESRVATWAAADIDVARELTLKLGSDMEDRDAALEALRRQPGLVRRLAFNPSGCRAVQLALEVADRGLASELAAGLRGSVVEAIESPHANHVLQKIVRVLTPQEVPFVVEEIREQGLELARHEYGCRVFSRLLEHAAADVGTIRLIDDMLTGVDLLLTDTYGHHVVECVLEHGLAHQRSRIVAALRQVGVRGAQDRMVAFILEKALLYGNSDDQEALASDLSAEPED